jgi:hypothetical protein
MRRAAAAARIKFKSVAPGRARSASPGAAFRGFGLFRALRGLVAGGRRTLFRIVCPSGLTARTFFY